jgi:hypothetical protein
MTMVGKRFVIVVMAISMTLSLAPPASAGFCTGAQRVARFKKTDDGYETTRGGRSIRFRLRKVDGRQVVSWGRRKPTVSIKQTLVFAVGGDGTATYLVKLGTERRRHKVGEHFRLDSATVCFTR